MVLTSHRRAYKLGETKMAYDRVIPVELDTIECSTDGCKGIVFNIVRIDRIKFARCLACGEFTLLTSEHDLG